MERNKIVDDWSAKYGNDPEVNKIIQERIDQMTDKEAKQTVMMDLLNWVRRTLPMDLDYAQMIEIKIESLLLKEQFQIMDAYYSGAKHSSEMGAEQYYNKIYDSSDETNYLLSTESNAQRLKGSIQQIKDKK